MDLQALPQLSFKPLSWLLASAAVLSFGACGGSEHPAPLKPCSTETDCRGVSDKACSGDWACIQGACHFLCGDEGDDGLSLSDSQNGQGEEGDAKAPGDTQGDENSDTPGTEDSQGPPDTEDPNPDANDASQDPGNPPDGFCATGMQCLVGQFCSTESGDCLKPCEENDLDCKATACWGLCLDFGGDPIKPCLDNEDCEGPDVCNLEVSACSQCGSSDFPVGLCEAGQAPYCQNDGDCQEDEYCGDCGEGFEGSSAPAIIPPCERQCLPKPEPPACETGWDCGDNESCYDGSCYPFTLCSDEMPCDEGWSCEFLKLSLGIGTANRARVIAKACYPENSEYCPSSLLSCKEGQECHEVCEDGTVLDGCTAGSKVICAASPILNGCFSDADCTKIGQTCKLDSCGPGSPAPCYGKCQYNVIVMPMDERAEFEPNP